MLHYAYLLLCRDGSFYCGYCKNPALRTAAHNAGKGARYTRSRLPVRLVYVECFLEKSPALRREAQFKRLSHAKKKALAETQSGNLF